jgi:conjugative transfer pilus assembly protein TraH
MNSSSTLRRLIMRFGACLGLLACTEGGMLAPAMADVNSEMTGFFSSAGAAGNVTGPGAFQGQSAGYYSLGNVWMRFPQRNVQPFNLQLPHARAGCGGIDLFAGSFSFINSAELIAMMKATANNAIGFAFKLAIDAVSPQISKVMEELSQKAEKLNQMNISSCETAQALVGGLWPKMEATRSTICEAVGNSQGLFSDWAATRQGCNNGGQRDATIAANTSPAMADQLIGEPHNYTWDVLKKSSQFSGFDQEFKELIMTLVGTIITQPSKDKTVGGKVAMIGAADDSVVQALLDGTQNGGAAVKILRCDTPDACLNPTLQSLVVTSASAIRPRVRQLIQNMATAIRSNSAIGTNEKALLNVASIPLYKVLAVQAASHVAVGADEIDTIAEITSIDIVQAMLQNLLDSFAQSKTSLVKADEHTAQMWQQSIAEARQRIANRGVSISQRVEVTMRVIDRSMMLESTLQNSMTPGMTAALNFGRGLNAQGIVQ